MELGMPNIKFIFKNIFYVNLIFEIINLLSTCLIRNIKTVSPKY